MFTRNCKHHCWNWKWIKGKNSKLTAKWQVDVPQTKASLLVRGIVLRVESLEAFGEHAKLPGKTFIWSSDTHQQKYRFNESQSCLSLLGGVVCCMLCVGSLPSDLAKPMQSRPLHCIPSHQVLQRVRRVEPLQQQFPLAAQVPRLLALSVRFHKVLLASAHWCLR